MLRTPFTSSRHKGLYLAILPIYGGEKFPILRLLRNMSNKFKAMKAAQTRYLIVDLRDNQGGNSLMN